MKKSFLVVLLILYACSLSAQWNNEALFNRIRPSDSLAGHFQLTFYNFNFVRNYEYANQFHDGYTLYGTQIEPQVVYGAHKNLAIVTGIHLRKDFGRAGVSEAAPIFSVKYQKKALTLIFGTLEGNIQHGYIEPLYDFDHKINQPLANGTQLLIDQPGFKLDSWIAWQKMIDKGEAAKEEIIGGFRSEIMLTKNGDWKWSVPLQLLAYHRGGQIDVRKDIPVMTLANVAGGIKVSRSFDSPIQEWFMEHYIAGSKDFSSTPESVYRQGYGWWLNTGLQSKWGSLVASYWEGDRFIAIKGMPLFQSVSNNLYDQGHKEAKRSILTLRYLYQKQLLPGLFLDVRFEPHWDLRNAASSLQFHHSFFLTYKQSFLIKAKNREK